MTRIVELPLAAIVAGGNDRTTFRAEQIEGLADSMRAHGLAQPITVRRQGDVYELVAGERRTRAARLLGWVTIPAIVKVMTDEQASAVMLLENMHRVDLDPLDEARAYAKRMTQFGWTATETARRAQVTTARVQSRLLLLDLVDEVQQLIAAGQLEPRFGEAMALLDANRQRVALRYLVATEKPSMREFRALCGDLLAAQAQEAMFDLDTFMTAPAAVAPAAIERVELPAAIIPPIRIELSVGATLDGYVADLLASEVPAHRDLAGVVGAIYAQLVRANLARPPRRRPATEAVA